MHRGGNLGGPNNFGTCILQSYYKFTTFRYQHSPQTAELLLLLKHVRSVRKIITKDPDCVRKAVRMRTSRDERNVRDWVSQNLRSKGTDLIG